MALILHFFPLPNGITERSLRDEEREMIVQEVSAETRESLLHPRKRMKKELMDNSRN
jgi:hypothetical protein